jgi:hypothetical protein
MSSPQRAPEGFFHERARTGRSFDEAVGFEDRHGAADRDHVGCERANLRRQELAQKAELVEHVADDGGKELAAAEGEQVGVGGPIGHVAVNTALRTRGFRKRRAAAR